MSVQMIGPPEGWSLLVIFFLSGSYKLPNPFNCHINQIRLLHIDLLLSFFMTSQKRRNLSFLLYWIDNCKLFDNLNLVAHSKSKRIGLNVSTKFPEFSDKNICHYNKKAWTCHLLCKRPGCYHSTSKTHVRDRIFKLSPIHTSVIYQIRWIQWKFCSI